MPDLRNGLVVPNTWSDTHVNLLQFVIRSSCIDTSR